MRNKCTPEAGRHAFPLTRWPARCLQARLPAGLECPFCRCELAASCRRGCGNSIPCAGWLSCSSSCTMRCLLRDFFPLQSPPPAGEPIEDALRKKFGPNAPQLMQRVVNSGREDGVQFADWKWRANTVKGGWMGAGVECGLRGRQLS